MVDFFEQLVRPLFTAPCMNMLILFYHWIGDMGLAIVLFSIGVQIVLWPFTIHGMRLQKHFEEGIKGLKVKIEELKEQYKDEPEQLQREIKAYYKGLHLNPFGSFIPILVQLPFVIGLFFALRELANTSKQAQPAVVNQMLYPLVPHVQQVVTTNVSWFAWWNGFVLDMAQPGITVLAMLAGLAVALQILVTQPEQTQDQDKITKRINTITPVVTLIMTVVSFLIFPTGLAVQRVVISLITTGQQYYVNGRHWGGLGSILQTNQRVETQTDLPTNAIVAQKPLPGQSR